MRPPSAGRDSAKGVTSGTVRIPFASICSMATLPSMVVVTYAAARDQVSHQWGLQSWILLRTAPCQAACTALYMFLTCRPSSAVCSVFVSTPPRFFRSPSRSDFRRSSCTPHALLQKLRQIHHLWRCRRCIWPDLYCCETKPY